ncbi:MAG: YihA family ribosome biogenesis GTP-binding protein [Chromatiales bacterium]|nr:YihA family ribosome biogenesis GTP-binding protein [Chromatiales bacterium]
MSSNYFQQTHFLKSAIRPELYPHDDGNEVAIIGRSNSGKSSTLNAICTRPKLARTSKIPGRTRMINFFAVKAGKRIVDLPGYGYARAAATEQQKWSVAISQYFAERKSLQGVVIVMDARRPLMENDWQVIHWLDNIAFHVLLNKIDKLKQSKTAQCLDKTSAALSNYRATVQLFSAHNKQGVEQARQKLSQWLKI